MPTRRFKLNEGASTKTTLADVFGNYEGSEFLIGLVRYDYKSGLFHAVYKYDGADLHLGMAINKTAAANIVHEHWMKQ